MKRLLILLLITVLTKSTFAILRNPDRVIIGNDTFFAYSDLFKNHKRRDSIYIIAHKQIYDLAKIANPEANGFAFREVAGIWEIIENKMFLIKMTDGVHDIDLNEIFKKHDPKEKVFADWLTDTIFISKGKILAVGARPIREHETKLILRNGVVISRTNYNNHIIKISDFHIDDEFIYQNINWDNIPDINEKTVLVYVGIQPKKNGKLDFIESNSFAIIDTEIIKDQENPFIIESIRIARLVPEWSVVIQRDKIKPQTMNVIFDQRLKKKYAR